MRTIRFMEWFNITWIFGIVTLACAFFFLQAVVDYNGQRGQIVPALSQVREIKKRHAAELEKVDVSIKEAEDRLEVLKQEEDALTEKIKEMDTALEVYKNDDSDDR
jgi:hypothetical protein